MRLYKKRIIQCLLVLTIMASLFTTTACGDITSGETLTNSEIKEVEDQLSQVFWDSDAKRLVDNCQDAVKQILGEGTKISFENYPVDESFLWWFASNYGEETLIAVGNANHAEAEDASLWYQASGATMHALWASYCRDRNYQTESLYNVSFKEAKDSAYVTLDFVGDICFAEDWYTTDFMDEKASGIFSEVDLKVLNELTSADVTIANNEFVLSNRGEATPNKEYIFCGNTSRVQLLSVMGIDLVSLANNHVYDHGQEGLCDTIDVLTEAGIASIGAGRNLDQAMDAHYIVVGGRKIGFVAATQIERYSNYTKEATEDTPGVLKSVEPTLLCQAIEETKKHCDLVVVYAHWGTEGYTRAESSQEALAEAYVAAGADLIIGAHPHRLEGVEFIENVPIVYSLGNFLLSDSDLYTSIAQITLDNENQFHVRMLPLVQEEMKVSMITEETEVDRFYKYLADNSYGVAITDSYEMVNAKGGTDPLLTISYRSAKGYETWSGSKDLKGRSIDIVGNLK